MSHHQSATSKVIDVQQFIDEHSFSPYQWLILFICFLIVAADGFDTAAIGFVAPAVAREWSIPVSALGPVLSAALVGLALGALLAGPIADRIGRRRVLIGSVFFFGLWTAACVAATDIWQLTVFRFLTGIGLGAALPNATTLLSEYVPAKRRALLLNIMFCGFTLGASAGGLAAAALIPDFGWRSVFVVGGAVPVLLAIGLIRLPESIRFMVIRDWPIERIRHVLRRIANDPAIATSRFTVWENQGDSQRTPIGAMLARPYRFGTLTLWLAYYMGLLVYYTLTSWMPTLIREAGFSLREAALVTALFPAGGVLGALIFGWLMDRWNPSRTVALAFLLLGVAVCAMGQGAASTGSLAVLTFVAGVCMTGAQMSMLALAALFYPTHSRATGVAWMLGVGRFGGILGAMGGGTLLAAGYSMIYIFTLMAAPAFVAALALFAMAWDRARPALAVH
ncbi:aromatic acid/H+ symport family MFS transporter [Cupriavidus numazuensis]|uniref:4-hydroxybenzoate transporter PcaK n=1 Tax=Cupriavidus numazuensis TaxID=221992 RepID=A0ABM8TFI4_9BURK|nr:aromatic acid/H+ symport family MFS transporter [Cupriavidus numazuensis]CAG2142355.1 4-hydroxybenzoate transporter PcaK [Cupriavidus numazuensis]